jgi:spore germination protein KB
MMRRMMISNQQLMALIVISTVGTSSLYAPSSLSHYADRDAWFLVLIGILGGALNLLVFLQLNKLYPDKSLIAICTHLLGRLGGGLLAVIFILYFMDVSSWVLREFAQFFVIALNPMIPQNWYLLIGIIMCAYAVFHGVEVISRVAFMIFLITIVTFLVIYLLLIKEYHFDYLLPVLENGFTGPLKGTIVVVSWFGDLMFISMVLNHVKRSKQTVHYAVAGVIISGIFLMMAVIGCSVVFGGKATSSFTYPIISLIQNIQLFRNIERLDAILIAIWVMSSFVKITVYFWSSLQALTECFRLSNPRLFIIPLAIGIVISSKYKVWGLIEMSSFYDKQAWYFVLFQFVLPVLLLVGAAIKHQTSSEDKPYGSG